METDTLLAELRADRSDLPRLVQRVERRGRPWVAVTATAVKGWEERDPEAWAKVRDWLISRGVRILTV